MLNHLNTCGIHPDCCVVGLRNLEVLETEKLIESSKKLVSIFLDGLKTLEYYPRVGEVRGTGLWLAIGFIVKKQSRTNFTLENLMNIIARSKQKGVLSKTMGMALEFAPPLIIQKGEKDEAILVLDSCICEGRKAMGLSK
jgi:adenosylmethionine-8-amino-7-oxononanoate aminotransferase